MAYLPMSCKAANSKKPFSMHFKGVFMRHANSRHNACYWFAYSCQQIESIVGTDPFIESIVGTDPFTCVETF